MMHSSYRPTLASGVEPPHYDRGFAEDYRFHHLDRSHSSSTGPSSPVGTSGDHFERKGQTLIASLLENRLFGHALVRDCSAIGVPHTGGAVVTTSPRQMPIVGTVPIAFVALSSSGRERSALGGDKESKRMKSELLQWIADFAPSYKAMKGKLIFVESIPRGPDGAVLRHLLIEKATSPPAPGPDKGFFNTVLSEPSTPAGPSKDGSVTGASETASPPKKAVRDSKRRATHSQIERRRREKINDRLVTLRSIVPACAMELEDRRRQKQEEEDEAARIAAGGAPKTYIDAATGKPKRKRNRRKPDPKKSAGADKEEELGLHKLEVLTHAINYIFELQGYIHKLETGSAPEHVPTADNPFGVRNRDGSYRQDAKIEDEPGSGAGARQLDLGDAYFVGRSSDAKSSQIKRDADDNDEEDQDEEDQIEDDGGESDDVEDGQAADEEEEEEDDDEPLERRTKKHMSSAVFRTHDLAASVRYPSLARMDSFVAPSRYPRTDTNYSSSSSRESVEVSPAFSLIQQSPSTISPATTITSPMMSLSAESPIMLPDPVISMSKRGVSSAPRVSQGSAFTSLPASALPLPSDQTGRRESSSFLFKQLSLASPNFVPFNGSNYAAAAAASASAAAASQSRARSSTLSFPTTYGEESELRDTSSSKTPGLSDRDAEDGGPSDVSAAALLLNFSTSPEVLRPIGRSNTSAASRATSVASSPHTRPTAGLPHRTRSTFSSPQYRPSTSMYSSKLGTPVSAVARAEMAAIEDPEPLDLASPPHLALDSGSAEEEIDQLSEMTVDELPEQAVTTAAETVKGTNVVQMETAR